MRCPRHRERDAEDTTGRVWRVRDKVSAGRLECRSFVKVPSYPAENGSFLPGPTQTFSSGFHDPRKPARFGLATLLFLTATKQRDGQTMQNSQFAPKCNDSATDIRGSSSVCRELKFYNCVFLDSHMSAYFKDVQNAFKIKRSVISK